MKAIAIPAKYECKRCIGRGFIGINRAKCPFCKGSGEVIKKPKAQQG